MTDRLARLHIMAMQSVASDPPTEVPRAPPAVDVPAFEAVYDTYFPYVWRAVRRLGVPPSQVDDVVQEVFIVVHRRLGDFEARSTLKTWLYLVREPIAFS